MPERVLQVYATSTLDIMSYCSSNAVSRMDQIVEQRSVLTETLASAVTQWQAVSAQAQEDAVTIRNLQLDNTSLREKLQELRTKVDEVNDLRSKNEILQAQLREALAHGSGNNRREQDERTQIPATQFSSASNEIVKSYHELLRETHMQKATIDALQNHVALEKAKVKKWRQRHPLSSSPAISSPLRTPRSEINLFASSPRSSRTLPGIIPDQKILEDCARVSVSPEAAEQKIARSPEIKVEPLVEITGNARKKRKSSSNRAADAISAIAEDGEDHNRQSKVGRNAFIKPRSSSPATTSVHRRLGHLLAKPTPPKPKLSRADSFKKINQPPPAHSGPVTNKPRFLPPKKKLLKGPEDDEPFRSRPINCLALTHFKISPDANEGLDFAYQDVVRNHHARKCLPGCTRKCCVDKFRALARTLPGTGTDDESLDDRISNNALLLDFLGHDAEERIRTLTSLARANLIEEAKTKIYADKYGRMHRNAHERPQSPPGFWNAEFPGTQEAEEDRERARKMEREEVERRYAEAMRGGGRWKFADE